MRACALYHCQSAVALAIKKERHTRRVALAEPFEQNKKQEEEKLKQRGRKKKHPSIVSYVTTLKGGGETTARQIQKKEKKKRERGRIKLENKSFCCVDNETA